MDLQSKQVQRQPRLNRLRGVETLAELVFPRHSSASLEQALHVSACRGQDLVAYVSSVCKVALPLGLLSALDRQCAEPTSGRCYLLPLFRPGNSAIIDWSMCTVQGLAPCVIRKELARYIPLRKESLSIRSLLCARTLGSACRRRRLCIAQGVCGACEGRVNDVRVNVCVCAVRLAVASAVESAKGKGPEIRPVAGSTCCIF